MNDKYNILLNRSNNDKRQDNFYVSFFNISENVGNYLGKQVKEVTRPNITIEYGEMRQRGNKFANPAQLVFTPVQITFADDEESLTSMLLYAQIMRQRERYNHDVDQIFGSSERKFKFGVKVQLFNSHHEETEGYILKDCFITSIEHSQKMYSGEQANTITVSIQFDNIDVKVFDRYLELTG